MNADNGKRRIADNGERRMTKKGEDWWSIWVQLRWVKTVRTAFSERR